MLYIKKVVDLFLKSASLLMLCLLNFPVYANGLSDLINGSAGDENQFCTPTDCFFPSKHLTGDDLIIEDKINWSGEKNLVLHTKGNILFKKNGKIIARGDGAVILKSGMMPGIKDVYDATVKFEGAQIEPIEVLGKGKIKIYHNPVKTEGKHKYQNPTIYGNIFPQTKLEAYMLVNDIRDLQDIAVYLQGSYALSQHIDASATKEWDHRNGFASIKNSSPFSGIFDGNNYVIENLYINRSEEEGVGLFGNVAKVGEHRAVLKDFTVKNAEIYGKNCVGVVIGKAAEVVISNVNVANSKINNHAGNFDKLIGCMLINRHKGLAAYKIVDGVLKRDNSAKLFGSCLRCEEVLDDFAEIIADDEDWFCTETDCYYPQKDLGNYNLIIEDEHHWNKDKNLVIHTSGSITFEGKGKIVSNGKGSIILKAGMEPGEEKEYKKTIIFKGDSTGIETPGGGEVKIYYNPVKGKKEHKYHNSNHDIYKQKIKANNLRAYMLVNNAGDLHDMNLFFGSYALSQNITAAETEDKEKEMLFPKDFDDNGYAIEGLGINRSEQDEL